MSPLPARLQTARTTLTRFSRADLQVLTACFLENRAHLAPWIDVPADPEGVAARLAAMEAMGADGRAFAYGIRRDGDLVGGAALHRLGDSGWALSYWLVEAAVGQGLATEVGQILVEHVLAAGSRFVELVVRPENRRSLATAARLGFTPDGTRLVDGAEALVWIKGDAEAAAWSALSRHLAGLGQGTLVTLGAQEIELVARCADGSALEIDISRAAALGAPCVILVAPVGATDVSPKRALAMNVDLAVGAYCLVDGALAVREVLPLLGTPPERVAVTAALLAEAVLAARRPSVPGETVAHLFSTYT